MVNRHEDGEKSRAAFVSAFVLRPEFVRKHPASLKAEGFIDTILLSVIQNAGVDLSSERSELLSLFESSDNGRAAVLTKILLNSKVVDAYYNQALVRTDTSLTCGVSLTRPFTSPGSTR